MLSGAFSEDMMQPAIRFKFLVCVTVWSIGLESGLRWQLGLGDPGVNDAMSVAQWTTLK